MIAALALLLSAASAGVTPMLRLAEDGRAQADIVVSAHGREVDAGVRDLVLHLKLVTGATFAVVPRPQDGRKAIRIEADPSLAEQEVRIDIGPRGVTLAGSDHPEYAIYDFLRDDCGVEWLDATEAGTLYESRPTLEVRYGTRTDRPFTLARRNAGAISSYDPLLWRPKTPGWTNYLMTAYPTAWAKGGAQSADLAMRAARTAFKRRMKGLGREQSANHSFYWFYDRFLHKDRPGFVAYHPEWFAKGYENGIRPKRPTDDIYRDRMNRAPQLCYTHPGVIGQTLVDVRAYFDHGGYTNAAANVRKGWHWGKDTYCLEPMDNAAFCRCPDCTKLYRPDRAADGAEYADYWFTFVNRIAREIGKSHPGRKISTLAYGNDREGLPSFPLEDNVVVHFCYSCNRMPNAARKAVQETRLRAWRKAYPANPMGIWFYNCFPAEKARRIGNCFPGFFGETYAAQYRMVQELDIRETVYNCGETGDFESYLMFRLGWKPDEDYAKLKARWFSGFGAAAPAVIRFYDLVERRYSDVSLYPPNSGHQTKEIAWIRLGDGKTMTALAACMDEAEAKADTPLARARVANWRAGVWDYMFLGKNRRWSVPTGRPGVTATLTAWNGMEPFPIGTNLLSSAALAEDEKGRAIKVAQPLRPLRKMRLALLYSDWLRAKCAVTPFLCRKGVRTSLCDEIVQTTLPEHEWRGTKSGFSSYLTIDFAFDPPLPLTDADGIGFADGGPAHGFRDCKFVSLEME